MFWILLEKKILQIKIKIYLTRFEK